MMTDSDKEEGTVTYYARYLSRFLRERNSPLSGDTAFIAERVEKASVAYRQSRRQGESYYKSQRAAMAVLTDGL